MFLSRSVRRVANLSKEYLACFQGFTAHCWEYQQNLGGRIVPSKRLASMVGAPASVSFPEVADDDQDAKEVIAFSKSLAGKVEEARDLVSPEVTEEQKKEASQVKSSGVEAEEERIREDKKHSYEEEPIPEIMPVVEDPNKIDEDRSEAGPSTPRPSSQKTRAPSGSLEPEGKKMKQTVVKPVRELESESSASKRFKPDPAMERRLETTQVGDDFFYRFDKVVGQEELWAYEYEVHEQEEEEKHEVPEALWSDAPLDRAPPDPPKWIEDLADAVEEWRLKRLGVLEPIEELKENHKLLTTRLVRDWRNKPNPAKEGSPKMFLRRSRLVAREYAKQQLVHRR